MAAAEEEEELPEEVQQLQQQPGRLHDQQAASPELSECAVSDCRR